MKTMPDGCQDDRENSANIVPLGAYLDGASPGFQRAVRRALVSEGFDLDEALPNLQLASHILEALRWLRDQGHDPHWNRFEAALRGADREGVLVDLGAQKR
jgi:hypothetical protein